MICQGVLLLHPTSYSFCHVPNYYKNSIILWAAKKKVSGYHDNIDKQE